jgi:hypothetical protein
MKPNQRRKTNKRRLTYYVINHVEEYMEWQQLPHMSISQLHSFLRILFCPYWYREEKDSESTWIVTCHLLEAQ